MWLIDIINITTPIKRVEMFFKSLNEYEIFFKNIYKKNTVAPRNAPLLLYKRKGKYKAFTTIKYIKMWYWFFNFMIEIIILT